MDAGARCERARASHRYVLHQQISMLIAMRPSTASMDAHSKDANQHSNHRQHSTQRERKLSITSDIAARTQEPCLMQISDPMRSQTALVPLGARNPAGDTAALS